MKKTQQCQFCKRFFKRAASHERFCKDNPRHTYIPEEMSTERLIYSVRDLEGAERAGQVAGEKQAMERIKNRLDDVKIKALDSAAKAVDAIAHMMGDM